MDEVKPVVSSSPESMSLTLSKFSNTLSSPAVGGPRAKASTLRAGGRGSNQSQAVPETKQWHSRGHPARFLALRGHC